jgi:hypothetical protein
MVLHHEGWKVHEQQDCEVQAHKDPNVARLTESTDDENKGSSIDSQNHHEMNRQHSCQKKK